MAELTRRDPPGRSRKPASEGFAFAEEAAFLRQHPGESYVIRDYPADRANAARLASLNIRTGRYRVFQPGGSFGSRTATEPGPDGELVVNVYAWFGELNGDYCAQCGYRVGSDGHANSAHDSS